MDFWITVALVFFVGNWLVVPLITDRTRKDGFWIGIIAALLTMVIGGLIRQF